MNLDFNAITRRQILDVNALLTIALVVALLRLRNNTSLSEPARPPERAW
jgi:hypothetical protein